MQRLHIRPFEPSDVHELIPMWRESFEHGVGIKDPHPMEAQANYFNYEVLPKNKVRLAFDQNRLVAFLASNSESIAQLHVRVQYFRQGIGTRLLDMAKEDSAGSLWLFTFAQNIIARRFYERHGFVDVQHGYEPTLKLDDVKYEWQRGPSAV
jgi:ribosomal protein S18 acetylase RimI-like enzyme